MKIIDENTRLRGGFWVRPAGCALQIVLGAVLATAVAGAQSQAHVSTISTCVETGTSNEFLGISTIRLWPGDAPEAKGSDCDDIPTLTELRPQMGHENGSAVVVMPGGAYLGLASVLEGREVADWFAARGFMAFVLRYRLGKKYLLPVPLMDARRAVQLVRARARDYHIAPNRIAAIGFSAGGHLAALSGTQFVAGNPKAEDPIDRVSSRPDFLILGYPWIGGISQNTEHLSYCQLMDVMERCQALMLSYSPGLFVTKDTPPTFIYHTTDDATVPVQQPLSFYAALLKAGVSGEIHIFAHGQHGSGLGMGNAALDQWPVLLESWLRMQGLLTRDESMIEIPKPAVQPVKAPAETAEEKSCHEFVQGFYDRYFDRLNTEKSDPESEVLRLNPAVLTTELRRMLKEQYAAEKKDGSLEYSIDADPFIAAQDWGKKYSVRTVTYQDGKCRAAVWGSDDPDDIEMVDPELVSENGKWIFVNFHYPTFDDPADENLVDMLINLRSQRIRDKRKGAQR